MPNLMATFAIHPPLSSYVCGMIFFPFIELDWKFVNMAMLFTQYKTVNS